MVVYIREAHPEDGWVVTMNRNEDIRLDDPTTTDERTDVAESCALRLEIKMPVVVDEIDDAVASAYGALPDRLYLIGRDGHVAFQGEPEPLHREKPYRDPRAMFWTTGAMASAIFKGPFVSPLNW